MKYALILAALLLAGCMKDGTVTTETGDVAAVGAGGGAVAYDVRTKDGVQCVVMVGYYKGGITCNWDAYNQENSNE